MYSTCIFCHSSLGTNEAVEHFPIGRRLAFDAVRGRLWVVCRKCERWNLTPLDERWEAIEECERLYRASRLRVSTDNIGLAKLREGTERVRIGAPQRPEFAAWRYGDQFGRRRRRQMLIVGAGIAGVGAIVAGGVATGVGIGGFGWMITQVIRRLVHGSPSAAVARVPLMEEHRLLRVPRKHLAASSIGVGDDGGIAIELPHVAGRTLLEGRTAERAMSLLMPAVNRFGGTRDVVASAVRASESEGSPEAFLARLARVGHVTNCYARGTTRRW